MKKRWFMSYVYKLKAFPEEVHYGSVVVRDAEHPIAKVARWNREIDYRTTMLLFYRELADDEQVPEFDAEA